MASPTERPLAEIFYGNFHDPQSGRDVPWLVRCNYCGHHTPAAHIDDALQGFYAHMYFGVDSSQEHREYATGKRNRCRRGYPVIAARELPRSCSPEFLRPPDMEAK